MDGFRKPIAAAVSNNIAGAKNNIEVDRLKRLTNSSKMALVQINIIPIFIFFWIINIAISPMIPIKPEAITTRTKGLIGLISRVLLMIFPSAFITTELVTVLAEVKKINKIDRTIPHELPIIPQGFATIWKIFMLVAS